MKHIFRILALAVTLVIGLTTVSAQTVQVQVIQKVPNLPSTATNYLDDPFRYFDIRIILNGAGSEGLDVFFDINFHLNDDTFYIRTKNSKTPTQSIHLSEGVNIMQRNMMLDQLRGRRETNIDFTNPLDAQLLPEGTYELCLDVYLWSDRTNPAREPISDGICPSYEICYSGSAPELVTPMTGPQMAMNGTRVVTPNRKVNFSWTPVISNCSGLSPRVKYKLKVVKVLLGQNYQDAIRFNPTVFSTEVRNHTYALFDTLRDVKVHMEKGALYVAQVQAEQIRSSRSEVTFHIANDGNSQPMAFFWDVPDEKSDWFSRFYSTSVDEEDEKGDESEGIEGLTVWEGGVEDISELDEMLEEAFPYDQSIVLYPKRHYVESDGYYTIPNTNDIEVGFMPVQSDELKNVSYAIELYDYVEGGVDSITAYEPLLSEKIDKLPENSRELVNRTLTGWGSKLQQGSLYYLQLTSSFNADYWNYSIADTIYYVNEMLAEHFHDTISREFVKDELENSDGIFFQWGDDPNAPAFNTPQWKAPVDRSGDDIYDPESYKLPTAIPEVHKDKSFPVSWTYVKNVTQGDKVEYEINVYELKAGQTLEEAVSDNEVLITRTLTDVSAISGQDTEFFKVFSAKKTYVMTLSTSVDGESETSYHFVNGNESLPIVFKVVK